MEKTSHKKSRPLLALCNAPNSNAAAAIAKTIVSARLAACVNVLPACRSFYRWRGRLEEAKETPMLIKTTTAKFAALQRAVLAAHPDEVPELIAVNIAAGLPAYLQWLAQETR